MRDLFRDSMYGNVVRFVTRGRVFAFDEKRDAALWERFIDREKSARMDEKGVKDGTDSIASDETYDYENQKSPRKPRRSYSENDRFIPHTRTWKNAHQRNAATGVPVDPEKGEDVTIVTWYGEDDPDNPLNWSTVKKAFIAFLICLLTFTVNLGGGIFTSGSSQYAAQFGVSEVAATLALCVYTAGDGFGTMVWSPLSENCHIGRTLVYAWTWVLFVFLQFGVVYAKNFGMLIAFRALTGFFGSPVLGTGGASMGDIYCSSQRVYAATIWVLVSFCAPVMGPVIGGYAAQYKGWQWTIYELLWISGFALILLFFMLPETSEAAILCRRSQRIRELTGRSDIKCAAEIEYDEKTKKELATESLVRPFSLTFKEPILFVLNLYLALIYGLLFIWFESFTIVFGEIYGFNLGAEGLSFLGIVIGALFVVSPLLLFQYYTQNTRLNKNGELKPELHLPPATVGALCVPICLFWFGWTSRPQIHWIVPIVGSSFFAIGAMLLQCSVVAYIGDAYPQYAASALAGNNFWRALFGAGFPMFATAMYRKLGVDGASSLLGVISVLFVPVPFFLYSYGARIRKASKTARHDL
ncbi:hypothetical protein HYFRA_00002809 [Hymenoscyphus fraxineus]|uniref:Major facilitator superfamily (MFS) profile domain-containing protein n=1 Tax=Hymenoscyphus fraxineus TaxID=746836 RepID=A0A9N9PP22_9HELO|nr:hypothetical protein HYFRA_00002809 [Hymenoscyphus fraxineus]